MFNVNEELCLHLTFSQGAMMMQAFLSKPKVPQERSVEEASEAVAKLPHDTVSPVLSTRTNGIPDSIVANVIFTGYVSDLEEDKDEAEDSFPGGADTREPRANQSQDPVSVMDKIQRGIT